MKKSKPVSAVQRVGLYVRVSGQEQAIKGLSLEAQQEDLEEYTKERGWIIAGVSLAYTLTPRRPPARAWGNGRTFSVCWRMSNRIR